MVDRISWSMISRVGIIVQIFLLGSINLTASPILGVGSIRCEYTINPISIETRSPRLSWEIESNQKDITQKAYQILVASTPETLEKETGDLWDTGQVISSQSVNVPYAGKVLKSRLQCYWKVRVWDNKGNVSEYSKPGTWEMGLLSDKEWQVDWISQPKVLDWKAQAQRRKAVSWDDRTQTQDPAPYLRKEFTVGKGVKKARIYITGLGNYELSLNGQKVGNHVLDPAFTRYDKRVLYVTYDVTQALKKGENAMGVILGNGWYNATHISVWGFDQAAWKHRPVLRSQLEIEYEDGTRQIVSTDSTWRVAHGPVLYNNLFLGETYDARKELTGWDGAGYDDSEWKQAEKVQGPEGHTSAQKLPPVKVIEEITPVSVSEPKPGVFIFDLGVNIAGWVKLTVSGNRGQRIEMTCSERLSDSGLVDNSDITRFVRAKEVQRDVYILKGDSIETWEPRFTYHGFQYVQVTGFSGQPTLENITGKMISTDFDPTGSFECSSSLFNKIQENTRRSFLSNFYGYPTDCPQREKNGWTGDAHLAAEQALYNFDVTTGYLKWLEDIKDEQQGSGELAAIIPTAGWGYFFGNGPAWDSAYPLITWYLYLYKGDEKVLEDHFENLKRYVDYLKSVSNNHIVSIGLGDWAPARTVTPVEITSTAYYYTDAMIVSKAAKILGRKEDHQKYAILADEIKKAFNKKFFDLETGMYGEGSQTALSCSLYQGLVDSEYEDMVVQNLVQNIEVNEGHLDAGILGTKYLLNSLSSFGRPDVAYTIASKETFPSWGYWINQGATTLWEFWDGEASRNHIMFGDISAWFYKTLGGIQPDPENPGFKRTIIRPYFPKDLDWVKSSHLSMYGEIKSNWEREGKRINLELSIPPNISSHLYLPMVELKKIKAFENSISGAEGIEYLESRDGFHVFEVGSGNYRLSFSKK